MSFGFFLTLTDSFYQVVIKTCINCSNIKWITAFTLISFFLFFIKSHFIKMFFCFIYHLDMKLCMWQLIRNDIKTLFYILLFSFSFHRFPFLIWIFHFTYYTTDMANRKCFQYEFYTELIEHTENELWFNICIIKTMKLIYASISFMLL